MRDELERLLEQDPWCDARIATVFLDSVEWLLGEPPQAPPTGQLPSAGLDLYPAEAALLVLFPFPHRVHYLRRVARLAEVRPWSLHPDPNAGPLREAYELFVEESDALVQRALREPEAELGEPASELGGAPGHPVHQQGRGGSLQPSPSGLTAIGRPTRHDREAPARLHACTPARLQHCDVTRQPPERPLLQPLQYLHKTALRKHTSIRHITSLLNQLGIPVPDPADTIRAALARVPRPPHS
nr:hypothetical protein [Streptomyces cyaneus]